MAATIKGHKVTRTVSAKYSDTINAECTCGWFYSLGKYSIHSNSMREVRQELGYHVADHLNEVSAPTQDEVA
jgi:hypothetical protein